MEAEGTVWVSLDQLARLEHLASNTMVVPRRTVRSLLSGRHPSAMRGRGLDFEEVRSYVQGDDIRNIDWRVTARTRSTHTKVFNEERERPVFVILDMSSRMFVSTSVYMKSVIAAQLAAILGYSILNRGDRFGGLIFNDTEEVLVKPIRNRPALQRFLRSASTYSQKLTETSEIQNSTNRLKDILKRIPAIITHDFIVHVISDFTTFEASDYQLLFPIKQRNDLVLTHIEDVMDYGLPDQKVVWTDGNRQVELQGSSSEQKSWRKFYDSFMETFKEQYTRYQIPTMVFNTGDSIENQVKSTLGKLLNR